MKSMQPVLAVFLLSLTHTVVAEPDPLQDNPSSPWYQLESESGWHFEVGIGVEVEPGYPGSDEYSVEPDILARAIYRTDAGHRFFVSPGEVGGIFSLSPKTQLVAFLELEEEREVDDDDALRGLDVVESTIEGQFMLAHRIGDISVFGVLQPDLTGDANKGLVWFFGVGYDRYLQNPRFRFATTFDISGADSEHMNTEFGINDAEAARTDYFFYKPGGAIKSATLGVSLEYRFSARLSLLGNLDMEHYFSEAADSPLIKNAGSEFTYEAGVLLRWQF